MLGKVIQNQRFSSNPYLYEAPFYMPHKCGDGNGGLAQFAGFYTTQPKEPKEEPPEKKTILKKLKIKLSNK